MTDPADPLQISSQHQTLVSDGEIIVSESLEFLAEILASLLIAATKQSTVTTFTKASINFMTPGVFSDQDQRILSGLRDT